MVRPHDTDSSMEVHGGVSLNQKIPNYDNRPTGSPGSGKSEPLELEKPFEVTIIARLYDYCLRVYKSLITNTLDSNSGRNVYMSQEIENGYQLLVIWGHDFDAAEGGLDTRLDHSRDLKLLVISVLVSLAKSTFQVFKSEGGSLALLGFDLEEAVREADNILHENAESDDDSSSSEYDASNLDNFQETLEDIKSYVQNLFDLIPAIETPARTLPNPNNLLVSDATKATFLDTSDIQAEQGPSYLDESSPQKRRKIQRSPEIDESTGKTQGDTQTLAQFVYPPRGYGNETEDENAENIWGYLIPLDDKADSVLCLKKRDASTDKSKSTQGKGKPETRPRSPGGYLVGRHPECDLVIDLPTISNRHFLLFTQSRKSDSVAILEDLSTNGTFVNDAIVGRNKHRELEDGDEVSILNEARFVFRYPHSRDANSFRQQYRVQQQLGKGHFATVYLCVEMATGKQYAVKIFEKRPRDSQRSQLQENEFHQEIALLKGVNHPSLLFLKEIFDENDEVYLVLELAPEGELFNLIVSKGKLTESETRHIFWQLFEGLKYLHDRGIVHRDIKPENVLIADKRLTVKLGDFGLAKIIGEESFTTTLCGTPSYVAPEIIQENERRYAKPVDIWSMGVVLYICLCGFPPFSDELHTPEAPYTLAQQIKMGVFDYPSPYWDSISDPALDLIDRMLTVDSERRLTVEECLNHPWMTNKPPIVDAEGLTGALMGLDFSKRKIERERTLLSSVNDSAFEVYLGESENAGAAECKVFTKNAAGRRTHNPMPAQVSHEGTMQDAPP